jgi:hypothetical protein
MSLDAKLNLNIETKLFNKNMRRVKESKARIA